MIPIPRGGYLRKVTGLAEAGQVAGIEEVAITAKIGQRLVPLPEGSSYLGFIFARATSPEDVETALRLAASRAPVRHFSNLACAVGILLGPTAVTRKEKVLGVLQFPVLSGGCPLR